MYALGEKYTVSGLKALAQDRFIQTVTSLNGASLGAVIGEVYTSTPDHDRGLRHFVLRITTNKVTDLLQDDGFRAVDVDIPRFGFEFLASTVEKVERQSGRSYKIGECSRCPYKESNPPLYCRRNRQAEQFCIL